MVAGDYKIRENRCRRYANRLGLILKKSRSKKWGINNQQGYMLVNTDNVIVNGQKFELSLDDVEKFLPVYEKKLYRGFNPLIKY